MNRLKQTVAAVMAGVMILSQPSFLSGSVLANETKPLIENVTTDKAMYNPGDHVEIRIDLENKTRNDFTGTVEINATHLEQQVGSTIEQSFSLANNEEDRIIVNWEAPSTDFKGYLIEVDIKDSSNNLIDSDTVGVDVSSSWTKFPRYGYVWDFTEDVDAAQRIEKLKDYHINALQYYDWKYRHHKPIPDDNREFWLDWTGREIHADSIRRYISEAQNNNMVNMAYNMAYAAVSGYEDDGVKQDWALYYSDNNLSGEGHFKFKMMDETPTGITHLYFFDMSNPEWQEYIFAEINNMFDSFEFDGWHSDTVGEWGEMQTADGRTLYVKDTYTEFLNNAKEAIGDKYLVFNPVGAQGIENVNISKVDVLYTEMWPWDRDRDGELYDSYYSLKKAIERAREESGGKSLVIPAYMSYDYGEANPGSPFNASAVLLTGASVYAAGGSRIELGDNGNMLSNEYFPAQHLYMTEELEQRMTKQYDFIVAYQNLLRDGQTETNNRIEVIDFENTPYGDPNTVWTYGKKDGDYEIIQMINLLGVSKNDWRANEGQKDTPEKITNFDLKYYYSDEINSVWLASPDKDGGRSEQLSFTKSRDEYGKYISITVPSLEYWNLIYMSSDDPIATSKAELNQLVERFIESGDLNGPLVKQLTNSFKQAEHHLEKGSIQQAIKFLEDYVSHLSRKSNERNVSQEAKQPLMEIIEALISYLKAEEEELTIPAEIFNGGFERGDLRGWDITGSNVGVDHNDVYNGNYKAYFWSNRPYEQKIEQDLSRMENGSYTVTAMVKQNTGTPTLSRMELTGFGGEAVYIDIPHGNEYVKISGTVEVTNGQINIAFYQTAEGSVNLQIDDVVIVKN
ncbi:glycoside hydrolase family 66 protein [Halalkalibacter alkalisediminis]|uniref:Glycoside hydrolase family 66 protein n=1 Tax=Halalkalibacter alkalisediminis TaxID=935616 RepID=A0ABV6NN43_9BACI|nr:glycoside hydrolase family 66 protein [Halalkalibacter alkalisediminis]